MKLKNNKLIIIKFASFSRVFIFQNKPFFSRKKIYWRYGPYMASKNCLYYSSFNWNPWSVNIMSLCDFISIWVSPPPPSFSCIFNFWTNHFSSRKKIYWRYSPYMAFKNCLNYSPFKWNHWCINIMSPRDFISIWVNPPPLIFVHFHILDQTFFKQKKNLLEI